MPAAATDTNTVSAKPHGQTWAPLDAEDVHHTRREIEGPVASEKSLPCDFRASGEEIYSRRPSVHASAPFACERERSAGAILAGGGDSGSRLRGVPWLLQLREAMSQRNNRELYVSAHAPEISLQLSDLGFI